MKGNQIKNRYMLSNIKLQKVVKQIKDFKHRSNVEILCYGASRAQLSSNSQIVRKHIAIQISTSQKPGGVYLISIKLWIGACGFLAPV